MYLKDIKKAELFAKDLIKLAKKYELCFSESDSETFLEECDKEDINVSLQEFKDCWGTKIRISLFADVSIDESPVILPRRE